MRERRYGRIVNVASTSGPVQAFLGDPGYHAAKAGIIGLTRAVALEVADAGITVNAVSPGWIATGAQLIGRAQRRQLHAARSQRHTRRGGRSRALPRRSDRQLHHRSTDRRRRRQLAARGSLVAPSDVTPVALITGAAGGIGGATADRFVAGGWRVAAVDINAVEPAHRPVDVLLSITADLRDVADCRRAVAEAIAWGRPARRGRQRGGRVDRRARAKTPPSRNGTV